MCHDNLKIVNNQINTQLTYT